MSLPFHLPQDSNEVTQQNSDQLTQPKSLIHDSVTSRHQAEDALKHYATFNGDGTYLIRRSEKFKQGYVLSVWYVIHHRVKRQSMNFDKNSKARRRQVPGALPPLQDLREPNENQQPTAQSVQHQQIGHLRKPRQVNRDIQMADNATYCGIYELKHLLLYH